MNNKDHNFLQDKRIEIFRKGVYTEIENLVIKIASYNFLDELMTTKETCKLLKVNRITLWRWDKSGKVQSVIVGGKRYYRRSDLLKFNQLNIFCNE